MIPDSMYLVLPVPFHQVAGELFVEAQAANGLDRWADNFAHVTVAAPVIPETLLGTLAGVRWVPVTALGNRARIAFQPLPWAYSPREFFRVRKRTLAAIRDAIAHAEHLQFAIGGLVGDWAAMAALEAAKMHRRYAIHTDRVEHEVMQRTGARGLRKLKAAIEAPLMRRFHCRVIRSAALGLWHGDECFRAYSPWCGENHLVHDVHTRSADLIGDEALNAKLDDVLHAPVLQLCYAGRLDPMKAPFEWLAALATARDLGASFQATWYGEGPLLTQAESECARLNLASHVHFAGFVSDRSALLSHLREAHALLFTHVTPESPRNLLEALVCGTPIVGYGGAYPEDLLHPRGGGALVPIHDAAALGQLIATLAQDRGRLKAMVQAAAENGRRFSDAAVFQERSTLIKRHT